MSFPAPRLLRAAVSRRTTPKQIHLPNGIEITHDQEGIPTVSAPNSLGCAFGQGYVSALHRLWPMEQQRRVAAARISEVAGPATLEIDRWICRLGLKEAVEAGVKQIKADPETFAVLEHFAEGVNYFIQQTDDWGLEFDLLGDRPEPWTVKDSIAILTLVSWSLAGNWEEQFIRLQTLAILGPEQAALLEADAWVHQQLPVRHRQELSTGIQQAFAQCEAMAEDLAAYQQVKQQAGLLPRRSGSNAWVVAGDYTESGKPVLAGDPHMPLGLPGLFYELHMIAEPDRFAVAGAAVAGVPGIISGRNQQLAWTITIAGAITAELRQERMEASTHVVEHIIKVKGQPQQTIQVPWGTRGPLVFPESALSLEWTGHTGSEVSTIGALWRLNRAQSVEELRAAAMQWGGPIVNFVWAEVEKERGAYGWRVAGCVPLRRNPAEGVLPAPAWEPAGQWAEGYIPASQLPEEIAPERGYIVSANNRMAPFDYPYVLSHEYMSPYRAERIEQLVQQAITHTQAGKRYTAETAMEIQQDLGSPSGKVLCNAILTAVAGAKPFSGPTVDPVISDAFNLLVLWDGNLSADSAAAAIIKVIEDYLYRMVAARLFPQESQASAWRGVAHTPINPSLMAHWRMREVISQLLIARPTGLRAISADAWVELARQAFQSALVELVKLQGKNPAFWSWGKLHQLELTHPLVQVPVYQTLPMPLRVLKKFLRLSRGPFNMGGDEHTPWQTSSHPLPIQAATHPRRFWVTAYTPAWRMVATDQGRYYGVLPGGVSGHANSRWADNQLRDYLAGAYHLRTIS